MSFFCCDFIYLGADVFKIKFLHLIISLYGSSHNYAFKGEETLREIKTNSKRWCLKEVPWILYTRILPFGPLTADTW